MIKKKVITIGVIGATALASMSSSAFASTAANIKNRFNNIQKPAVVGVVDSISGSTINVSGKNGTTYAVDATAAKITEGFGTNAKTLSVTDVKIGDEVAVQGTLSGSSVAATTLRDQGNEAALEANRPAFVGKVKAISGTTLTVASKGYGYGKTATTTTYSVDATSASVTKGFGMSTTTLSFSDIKVGDVVGVAGSVSGTSVTATRIFERSGVKRNDKNMSIKGAPYVGGKVSAVNGSSFTIVKRGGKDVATTTITVTTSGTTTYKKDGDPATISDVASGDFVIALGTLDSSGTTMTATSVNVVTKALRGLRKKV